MSAPLSDGDAQELAHLGLETIQDIIGVIWETIFFSKCPGLDFLRSLIYLFFQARMGSSSRLLYTPSRNLFDYLRCSHLTGLRFPQSERTQVAGLHCHALCRDLLICELRNSLGSERHLSVQEYTCSVHRLPKSAAPR